MQVNTTESLSGERNIRKNSKRKKIEVLKKAAERQIPLNSEYFWFSILLSAGQLMARFPTVVAVLNFQVLE